MTFNEWFDKHYPEGTLGQVGAMRLAFKEVAEKAYYYGLGRGFDCSVDSVLRAQVWYELENLSKNS